MIIRVFRYDTNSNVKRDYIFRSMWNYWNAICYHFFQGSSSCLCSMSILILHSKMFIAGAQWLVHLTFQCQQQVLSAKNWWQHAKPSNAQFIFAILSGFVLLWGFLITCVSPEYVFLLPNRLCKKMQKIQRQVKVFLKAISQC